MCLCRSRFAWLPSEVYDHKNDNQEPEHNTFITNNNEMAFPYERVPFQVFSCVTHINYIIVSNCNRNCAVLQAILLHFIFECPFRSSFFLVNFSLLSHLLARRTKQIHLQENLFYGFLSHIPWRNEPTKKKISLFLNASEVFDADFVVPLSLLSNSFMAQWRNAFCEEEKMSIIFAHLLCFAVELVECPHATLITVK